MAISQSDQIRAALEVLRAETGRRGFGVVNDDRRACVAHGYLLCLEDVERVLTPIVEIAEPVSMPACAECSGAAA